MKPCLFILIMVLAIMVGCTPKGDDDVIETRHGTSLQTIAPSPVLSSVDSLMWVQPDSALACLMPYFDTCCRDAMIASPMTTDGDFIETHAIETHAMRLYNRHYAHLLLAELLYKNDYAQTNRTELLEAVGYFDSLVREAPPLKRGLGGLKTTQSPTQPDIIAFLDARAHYINGVGYYERDSVVEACKEYFKALGVMEGHIGIMMLKGHMAHFLALDYTRLNTIYSGFYLHEQAIFFARQSIVWFQKSESSQSNKAWMLGEIGVNYDMMEQLDSARYYYNEAMKVLDDERILLYRDMTAHQICLEYKSGTKHCDSVLLELHRLLTESVSEEEYLVRCSHIGEVFYHERRFDSASHYLKLVYCRSDKEGLKKQAAEWLVEIAETQERKTEAIKYARFLVPFANMEENQSAIKSQLTEQYKNHVQSRLERERQKEKMKSQRLTIVIVGSLLILMSFITILYYKNRKKKQHLETQIAAERHSHQIQQDALSGKLKQKSQEVRELQDQIKQQNDRDAAVEPTISFAEEPICRLIMERVKEGQFKSQMDCNIYKDFALSKEQLIALHNAANRHFAGLTMRLKKAYPQLTDSDLNYCCLYLLGLTDADVAALMQKAYPTVSQRSRKLKTIFGSETSLPITLHNFANNDLSH